MTGGLNLIVPGERVRVLRPGQAALGNLLRQAVPPTIIGPRQLRRTASWIQRRRLQSAKIVVRVGPRAIHRVGHCFDIAVRRIRSDGQLIQRRSA